MSSTLPKRTYTRSPRVAIVGGGISGLTSAYYLLRAGCDVTIYEAHDTLGGLAATFDYGPFQWDRFYHCILTSDEALLGLLDDLELSDALRWQATEVGFYSRGELHTMTRPLDLLRFPHLSLWNKARFALGTLYASRFCSGEGLEGVPLRTWIEKVFGPKLYQEMWAPLLQCKLGSMQDQASAAFLWATLRRLYSTRDQDTSKQERLGFVDGGYQRVLGRLEKEIARLGGRVRCGTAVGNVEKVRDRVLIRAEGHTEAYDSVVLTVPSRLAAAMCPTFGEDYLEKLQSTQYLGIVCAVALLRQPLSRYYVTNITDASRFTGIIEMTNLIGTTRTAGHSLLYLPKYTAPSDPLFQKNDAEVWDQFERHLLRMHPTLQRSDFVQHFVFRERFVQPVPTLHYSDTMPTMRTPLRGVYLANTSQIVNDTLNNNAMVRIARDACRMVLDNTQHGKVREGLDSAVCLR
jgi:protoporphyrinogen oxidase